MSSSSKNVHPNVDPCEVDEESERELESMSNDEILARTSMMSYEVRVMENSARMTSYQMKGLRQRTESNKARLKAMKRRPLLVSEVQQIFPDGEGVIVKTSSKRTVFVQNTGLIGEGGIEPGDLVSTNRDSFIMVEKLPKDIDQRVKSMEIMERPNVTLADIGGLEHQIRELMEAVVLPITHRHKFTTVGITSPKGVLLHGAPGTGKTLLARACANRTNCTFFRLAGPSLVQRYVGDGAKMVREAFLLAKAKAPSIIFIDELDAIGSKRGTSEYRSSGEREVNRTLIELLNQMDGFSSSDQVKVIGATNRVDVLDPALLRSGRMDRKIEFPEPDERARTEAMKIHSRMLKKSDDVDLEEVGKATEGFSFAMCKALCTEAAMSALRRSSQLVQHADFLDAISEVLARKKPDLSHYS